MSGRILNRKMSVPDREGDAIGSFQIIKFMYHFNNERWFACKCLICNERFPILTPDKMKYYTSCGCKRNSLTYRFGRKLDKTEDNLLKLFLGMHGRCEYERHISYPNYGGRGIQVDTEWNKTPDGWLSFYEWAFENNYNLGLSIERKDIDRNYSSNNCYWTTKKEQGYNKRTTLWIDYNGENVSLAKAHEISKSTIPYKTVFSRIKYQKMNVLDALFKPLGNTSMKTNWKGSEYCLRDCLLEFMIPAYRKSRGQNYSISDTDVGIEGEDWLKLDSKYTKTQPFKHHGKLKIIKDKYCKEKEDVAILFTKNYKEHLGNITVSVRFFSMLLAYWLGVASKEKLWSIFLKESTKVDNTETDGE